MNLPRVLLLVLLVGFLQLVILEITNRNGGLLSRLKKEMR